MKKIRLTKSAINSLFIGSIVLLSTLILAYIYTVFKFPSLGPDSGYYLKIAHDLSNGLNFYGGINCAYTPLMVDTFSIPFYFNKNTSLIVLFAVYLAIYTVIAVVLYKILHFFNESKKLKLFFTIMFVCSLFTFEGVHILLEPHTILFQLLAILLLLQQKAKTTAVIGVGFLMFLSFYSKQYGLFIAPAVVYYIYKNTDSLQKVAIKLSFLGIGFLAPIVILAIYFKVDRELATSLFIKQLLGIEVLSGEDIVTGVAYNFDGLHGSLERYIKFLPHIFFFLVLLPTIKKVRLTMPTIFILLLLFCSYTVLKFAYYPHYYQLIAPYTILLFACIPAKTIKKNILFFGALGIVFLVTNTKEFFKTYSYKKEIYTNQQINIKTIKTALPEHSKVFLQGISPAYYFLNKFDSPNYKKIGYKFPEEMTANYIATYLNKDNYIIVDSAFIHKKEFTPFSREKEIVINEGRRTKRVYILKKYKK